MILIARCSDEQTYTPRTRLEQLYEDGREVSFDTFFREISLKYVSEILGYDFGTSRRHGIRLRNDVVMNAGGAYHRSTWRGVPCMWLIWSGIDHVFIRKSDQSRMTYFTRDPYAVAA